MEKREMIAIFGGAFNPPLNSHIYLALEVLKKLNGVKKVIFVPVNSEYNKEGLIANEHRYNMLKLVSQNHEDILVSSVEIESERPLYTIETLEYMKKEYPNNDICLIIGSDNLAQLSTWKKARDLISEFKIVVFKRGDDDIEKIIEADLLLKEHKEAFIEIDDNIHRNISSTIVRNMIKSGEDVSTFMKEEVLEYIRENKLYV